MTKQDSHCGLSRRSLHQSTSALLSEQDTKVIAVGRLEAHRDWRFPPHSHQFHELIVIMRGIEHVTIRGQRISAGAGDVLFYPVGVTHEEWADPQRPFESRFVAFDWLSAPADLPVRIRDTTGRLRQMISWLYADRNVHGIHGSLGQAAFLRAILTEYVRAAAHPAEGHRLLATIQGYIQDRIGDPIRLDDLASIACMSKYHFLRTYKALARRTPMEEVRTIRLHCAQELILSTDVPLKEVAVRCGLSNEYLLSRLFRRQFGMPPGEMRQARRAS